MPINADRFDTLDDEALMQLLTDEADRRRERPLIEERPGGWIAETYQSDGLSSGRTVMLGAAGPDRRTAMSGLAEKFEANRSVAQPKPQSLSRAAMQRPKTTTPSRQRPER